MFAYFASGLWRFHILTWTLSSSKPVNSRQHFSSERIQGVSSWPVCTIHMMYLSHIPSSVTVVLTHGFITICTHIAILYINFINKVYVSAVTSQETDSRFEPDSQSGTFLC